MPDVNEAILAAARCEVPGQNYRTVSVESKGNKDLTVITRARDLYRNRAVKVWNRRRTFG